MIGFVPTFREDFQEFKGEKSLAFVLEFLSYVGYGLDGGSYLIF